MSGGKDERIGLKRFLRAAVRETHRAQRPAGKLDIREFCAEAHLAAVGENHFTKPLHGARQTVGADVRLGLPENFVRRSGLYEIVQHLPAALIVRAGVELAVRERARAALTELDVRFGVQRAGLIEFFHVGLSLVHGAAALEQYRLRARARERERGEESRRAGPAHNGAMGGLFF